MRLIRDQQIKIWMCSNHLQLLIFYYSKTPKMLKRRSILGIENGNICHTTVILLFPSQMFKKIQYINPLCFYIYLSFFLSYSTSTSSIIIPLCDKNIGTRDRSFFLEIRCLSHLLWLNHKIFLIGTNGIQKFVNLACSHNFFRFLIAL